VCLIDFVMLMSAHFAVNNRAKNGNVMFKFIFV